MEACSSLHSTDLNMNAYGFSVVLWLDEENWIIMAQHSAVQRACETRLLILVFVIKADETAVQGT